MNEDWIIRKNSDNNGYLVHRCNRYHEELILYIKTYNTYRIHWKLPIKCKSCEKEVPGSVLFIIKNIKE